MAPAQYSEEIASLSTMTIEHKKYLEYWPSNYTDLIVYAQENEITIANRFPDLASTFFSASYDSLNFIPKKDSIQISFITSPFKNKKNIYVEELSYKNPSFFQLIGNVIVKRDTLKTDYSSEFIIIDVLYFDKEKRPMSLEY